MKKQLVIVTCCLLVFLMLPITIQASDASSASALQTTLATPVTYDLPYPGLLPDNPLYVFKVLRDRLVSFFITDAQKQAEFDLLQADKRLVAAEYLMKEPSRNNQLISQTVSKGENYFADAVINITKAQQEGRLVNDFLDKLSKASIKHQQVLYMLQQQSSGQLHGDLGQDIQRVQKFATQVNALKPH